MLTDSDRIDLAEQIARVANRLRMGDSEDTFAAALLAVVEAEQHLRADVVNPRGFIATCATREVRAGMWASVSPVTHHVRNHSDIGHEVAQVRRVSTDAVFDHAAEQPTPEDEVGERLFRVRFHSRLASLCEDDPPDEREAVFALVTGSTPAEVADDTGIPAEKLYQLAGRTRARIKRDAHMRRLHREHVAGAGAGR